MGLPPSLRLLGSDGKLLLQIFCTKTAPEYRASLLSSVNSNSTDYLSEADSVLKTLITLTGLGSYYPKTNNPHYRNPRQQEKKPGNQSIPRTKRLRILLKTQPLPILIVINRQFVRSLQVLTVRPLMAMNKKV